MFRTTPLRISFYLQYMAKNAVKDSSPSSNGKDRMEIVGEKSGKEKPALFHTFPKGAWSLLRHDRAFKIFPPIYSLHLLM